jgi:hypothetical protein
MTDGAPIAMAPRPAQPAIGSRAPSLDTRAAPVGRVPPLV